MYMYISCISQHDCRRLSPLHSHYAWWNPFRRRATLGLRQITLGMFPPSKYEDFRNDIPVLIAVSVFVGATGMKNAEPRAKEMTARWQTWHGNA